MTPSGTAHLDKESPQRLDSWRPLAKYAALLGGFVILALLTPYLTPFRATELAGDPLEAPGWQHPLGTNLVGQDVMSQLLYGTRVSLLMAFIAGGGTLMLGAAVGITAGWTGNLVDALLMRFVDVVLVIPKLPLLIVVGAYAGQSLITVALIIALASWPPTARVLRAQVLSLRRRTHLKAAIGFGAGTWHIFRRHILPELGLLLAAGLVAAAGRAVMLEAGLAFLGLGDPARASWGAMLRDAMNFSGLFFTWAWTWWLLPPLIAIVVLLLTLTFVTTVLEARLNPQLSRHAGSGGGR